ncbi:MAG TPA: accessory factor UbiK family protein [Stellaceae bacterium]|jgi:BMFP domain-containing protein YqiC|nr:accessory factor UbiK family protein [Stellaceae bacterium]
MQTQNRLLDDLARVATGAFGAFTGMRDEVETRMKEQFERVLGRMNLVTREEYDAVKAMAAKARAAQEALEKRVAALEAKLGVQISGSREKPSAARPSSAAAAPAKGSRSARPRRTSSKSR